MFNVGDVVYVKDYGEIEKTFEPRGSTSTRGVYFISEMREFCGKQFVIMAEAETRTYVFAYNCEGNFYIWAEEWLRPAVKSPNEIF